jgi:hypothetical protein
MLRSTRKLAFLLVLGAIALLAFATTADLLPHQHDSGASERVCPVCHPSVAGMQPAELKLPSLSDQSWIVVIPEYFSVFSTPVRLSPSRAPPLESIS